MRRKLFFIITLMLVSLGMWAQEQKEEEPVLNYEAGQFTLMPKVGMNMADLLYDADDTKPRWGLTLGLEAEYMLSRKWGLAIGVMFSRQGARGSTNFGGITWKNPSVRLDYINIPLLVKLYMLKNHQLAIKMGVQSGIRAFSQYSSDAYTCQLEDVGIGVRDFDFAIPLGICYEKKGFVLDCTSFWGFIPPFSDEGGTLSNHNFVVQFTLGYRFDL